MKSELEVAMSESLKTVYPYLGKHMMGLKGYLNVLKVNW
jgi:hypothetical protein